MKEMDRASPAPADVEREIGRTRADITQTLDALELKLNPRHIAEMGVEMFNTNFSGGDAVNRGLAAMRANPVPVALIGIGAAWLLASNTGLTDRIARTERTGTVRRRVDKIASTGLRAGSVATDGETAPGVPLGHTGNALVDQSAESSSNGWVHQMSDMAQGALRTVRDSSGAAINRAGAYAGDGAVVVADQLNDTFERHPLLIGAIGAMAGALVAALLPLTRTEAEWVSNTREQIWRHAEEAGQQAVNRVRDAASQAVSRAADAAANAAVATIREELAEPSARRSDDPR